MSFRGLSEFLCSKYADAEIRALKSENCGLWNVLKRFFISLFNKLSAIYKGVDPDSVEGKYIADMRKALKPIRDAFMEGAAQASKNVEAKKKTSANSTEAKSENMRTVTIVSSPGTENEKPDTIQVDKGLQVGISPDFFVDKNFTLYADPACTQIFEEDWDVNTDITIYVKWYE